MRPPVNVRNRKPRQLPKCEACKGSCLQVIADGSLRCQNCGHQQHGKFPKSLGPVIQNDGTNYAQPNTKAPDPKALDYQPSLNPLGLNSARENYQQPNVITPAPVNQESLVKGPPVGKEDSGNYQHPDYGTRAPIPAHSPRVLGPSFVERSENYQQPHTETPTGKIDEGVKVAVFVPAASGNIQQPDTDKPASHPDVGIHVPHLNAMALNEHKGNYVQPGYHHKR